MKVESILHTHIAISFIPKLNSNLSLPFVEKCGGIEAFFRESEDALNALGRDCNVNIQTFNRKEALAQALLELKEIEKHDIQTCTYEDDIYPNLLKQCEDVPLTLYYKGNIQTYTSRKYLAVVGTRKASEPYKELVSRCIEELQCAKQNLTIVSGLAYGIDAAAHRACIKNDIQTFAVLGHGLHMIYPASHNTLAANILEQDGALISEFPCISKIHPSNFLKRNRIVAGLCQATLVAESAIKGGAMATARTALSYNREVMAFPGRPHDNYSAGCNLLIKGNIAALVENAKDIADILDLPLQQERPIQTALDFFSDEDKSQIIKSTLQKEGDKSIDELSLLSGIPIQELSALLLEMELDGKIISLPGKRFSNR